MACSAPEPAPSVTPPSATEEPADAVKVAEWDRVQGKAGRTGPTVALTVRRDGIYRGDALLVPLAETEGKLGFREGDLRGQLCEPLHASLVELRGQVPGANRAPTGDGTVVLRATDGVPFEIIRVVLFTAGQAGYPQHELQAEAPADG